MKERPILFSAPMVRALLDGSKTQTRRIVKPQPVELPDFNRGGLSINVGGAKYQTFNPEMYRHRCPYGKAGDLLWVRETWRHTASSLDEARAITDDIMSGSAVDWRADYVERLIKTGEFTREDAEVSSDFETWKPSIHMPRWASRIMLEIINVRIEQLQGISEDDAEAEGIEGINQPTGGDDYQDYWRNYGMSDKQSDGWPWFTGDCIASYKSLWESINGAGSWNANPWVWVVEFKVIKP